MSIKERVDGNHVLLTIPNEELRRVWKTFVFEELIVKQQHVRTLFDNIDTPERFASDLNYFLKDRMSCHDLARSEGEDRKTAHERAYHIFLLGLLSAFEDMESKRPLSNRESGDGRYDIMLERKDKCIIFELKACDANEEPDKMAKRALEQIDAKRYGAEVGMGKKLIKVGIAFFGKNCSVKVG